VFQPAGIQEYAEDLKHGPNADIEPEDIFDLIEDVIIRPFSRPVRVVRRPV
jgi:hypothetical protein